MLLTCFLLYLAMAVDDFRVNPLHATHLGTNDLIQCDPHNTEPIHVMDHRQKNCARALLKRSCKAFAVLT